MAAPALSPAQIALVMDTAAALTAAPHGGQGAILARAAAALGCSRQTLYRYLRDYAGWTSGRKPRADRGETRVEPTLAMTVAGLVREATRANGKRTMSIKAACRHLAANGEGVVNPSTGEVTMPSPETMARAMRELGCHPEQLAAGAPSVRLQSPHPNHAWQADASVCVIYKLPGGQMGVMDEKKYYKNKPHRLAELTDRTVIRWVVADHNSGALYLRYDLGAEDAKGLIDTLVAAMCKRGDRDPLHGVPKHLGLDKGPGNTSGLVLDFLARLGITPYHHATGNARASGAVEKAQDIIETEFESRLRFMAVPSVEALQELADRWRRHFNHTAIHSRHKRTRNAMWLTITDEQLRTVERKALEALAVWRPVTRKIRPDFSIGVDVRGYGAQQYDLRELGYHGLNVGDTVTCVLNVFAAPALNVTKTLADGSEKTWLVQPMTFTEAGFDASAAIFGEEFRALPDTGTDQRLKAMGKLAYGAATLEGVAEAKKAGAKPFAGLNLMADVREAPLVMPRTGTRLDLAPTVAEPAPLSHAQACLKVRGLIPEVWASHAAECNAAIKERYPVTVPETALDELARELAARFGRPVLGTVTTITGFATVRAAARAAAGGDSCSA